MGNSIVTFKNLPADITEEQIADYLWANIGLNIPPECISCSPHTNIWATIVLTREACADFLNRVLQGHTIQGYAGVAYQPRVEASQFAIRPHRN
jgi:hypothetical protein